MQKLLMVFLAVVGCNIDLSEERAKILDLHHRQRDMHFTKSADSFVGLFSQNTTSVNRGTVSHPSPQENLQRFRNYFERVDFVKWDDVAEPEISFSRDGTMAYTVVQKEVVVRPRNTSELDTTRFAWVAIYVKVGKEWKIDCVASTN